MYVWHCEQNERTSLFAHPVLDLIFAFHLSSIGSRLLMTLQNVFLHSFLSSPAQWSLSLPASCRTANRRREGWVSRQAGGVDLIGSWFVVPLSWYGSIAELHRIHWKLIMLGMADTGRLRSRPNNYQQHACRRTCRHTGRHMERQASRLTDRQAGRPANRKEVWHKNPESHHVPSRCRWYC